MTNDSDLDLLFRALADPTRRAIVATLVEGPASVSELAHPHGMALPSFLQHLRVLEAGRLIRTEKRGRIRVCEAEPEALRMAEHWLHERRAVWQARLDRFEAHLKTLNAKDIENE